MSLSAGARLGPYEILGHLGEGGMGVVYRARDTRLGREVALKVIPFSRHEDAAVRSRFEREAQALAALNHPHIAAIHDLIEIDDHRAIVMELVAGPTCRPSKHTATPADARSDVFSLGVVLYEAISGRRAFHGDTTAAFLAAVLRDDPPPLRTIVPTTPRAVERCAMRCMEKDPRRRYHNAADLMVALEDLREDLTTPDSAPASASGTQSAAGSVAIVTRMWPPLLYAAAGLVIGTAVFIYTGALGSSATATPVYRPFITEVTSATNPGVPQTTEWNFCQSTARRWRDRAAGRRESRQRHDRLVVNGPMDCHSRPDGLHLVAPDGRVPMRVLALHADSFRFSHDGSRLFAVRHGENRRWELTIWDVAAGRELRVVELPVAAAADLQSLALSLDDAHIIVSAGTNTSDIWLLEQFEPPSPWARWLRRYGVP